VTGGLLSVSYAFCFIFYDVTPRINGFHIQYVDNFPSTLVTVASFFYPVATVVPLFVSSVRRVWLFGILITISYIVTGIFFAQYLTSVWCFFAALISVAIYWVLSTSPATASSEALAEGRGS